MILRVAWRSIARNRRRTLVTTGAMAFAGAIMIFYSALLGGYFAMMLDSALGAELGELQIHAPRYRADPDLYKRIEDEEALLARLEAAGFTAAPRLYAFALAAAGSASSGVQVRGIDVAREAKVTRVHERVDRGAWVSPEDPRGAVLGKKLARALGVDVGDELVVLGQAADGSMANELYAVRGVLRPVGELIDRGGLFLPAASFRALFAVPDGAHELALIGAGADLERAKADVERLAPGQETNTWRELQPVIARMMDLSGVSELFMLFVVYLAVGMVVLNAALMSVFERMREFGMMKAIGVTPAQIAGIVLAEATLQVALASVVAIGVGLPLALYFETHGIDLSAFTDSASLAGVLMDPIWTPDANARAVALPIAMMLVAVLLAVVYPGVKAALIQPIRALRHR